MKTFVLRLQVSSSSEDITKHFDSDNEVVIPMAVYERLNSNFVEPNRRSTAARVLNYIESLPVEDLCNIEKGYIQSNGSKLFLLNPTNKVDDKIHKQSGLTDYDKQIFQLCLELQSKGKEVVLISKNQVIRTKSKLLGIPAEPFKDELAPALHEQYSGKGGRVIVSQNSFEKMYKNCDGVETSEILESPEVDFVENMFFKVTPEYFQTGKYILGRYTNGRIVPLKYAISENLPKGLLPQNDDQKIMLECLLAPPEIAPMVVIKGPAGSGKTYSSIACSLSRLYNQKNTSSIGTPNGIYEQIMMSAPMIDMEKIGALPGDKDDKMENYLQGIQDNVKNYYRMVDPEEDLSKIYSQVNCLFGSRFIDLVPATFMRGRSLHKYFVICDEAQNYRPDLILDITTRSGKSSKVVFLGDPTQINNPECSTRYNGVTYASEAMKGESVCWQVTLDKTVRSDLAEAAIRRMKK